jgi:cysteine-rich repeat protein
MWKVRIVFLLVLVSVVLGGGCVFDPRGAAVDSDADVHNQNNNNSVEECGNGALDGDEGCDDGNTEAADGCDANCRIEWGWRCNGEPSSCVTVCGDGIVAGQEACDDGNELSGDGCSDLCSEELGWSCTGEPSQCEPGCGDGLVAGPEDCDDGNNDPGDGCSPSCHVELGWYCQLEGDTSVCRTECGDGLIAGQETCDDANEVGSDGCSAQCLIEDGWTCSGESSVCEPICGDGLVRGAEGCDDGATADGDGCSAQCGIEYGWTCGGEPSTCDTVCGDSIRVDGEEACDDGNTATDDGCSAQCALEAGWSCSGEPSVCAQWYDADWGFRKMIVIDHTQVAGELVDFPVLIHRGADGELSASAQADGDDVVFTAQDGTTVLSHEIQRYLSNSGELIAWVKVPLLSASSDTRLYLYYGEPDVGSQQSVADVWANGYAAVLHLQEQGDGSEDEYRDSSGNGHHGTGGGRPGDGDPNRTPQRVDGWHGYALEFDGGQDHLRLQRIDDGGWGAVTVQIWINPADDGDDRVFAKGWGTGDDDNVWQLGKDGDIKVRHRTNDAAGEYNGGDAWTAGDWYLFAYTWDSNAGGAIRCYQNGVVKISDSLAGDDLHNDSRYPIIGNIARAQLDRGFDGLLQEARLSSVARSEAWMQTEFVNVADPDTFYTVYGEEIVN